MKAKIIKTGEIVDVYHESQHGQITNIYKESVFLNSRIWTEDELIFFDTSEEVVDLEKEIFNYFDNHNLNIQDGGRIVFSNGDTPNLLCDFRDIVKHFFELGLKAQRGE